MKTFPRMKTLSKMKTFPRMRTSSGMKTSSGIKMFSRMKTFSRMKMFSGFLLFMALSSCVCGLELNATQDNYQREEKQNITLEWIFTPKPQDDLKNLFVHCDMFTEIKDSNLFLLLAGVESSESQSEEFSGRVHVDKDKLKEGNIGLHVSSLRINDSGWYRCEVKLNAGVSLDKCHLNVTAAIEPRRPGSGGPGRTGSYWGLTVAAAAAVGFMVV